MPLTQGNVVEATTSIPSQQTLCLNQFVREER